MAWENAPEWFWEFPNRPKNDHIRCKKFNQTCTSVLSCHSTTQRSISTIWGKAEKAPDDLCFYIVATKEKKEDE
jgi:hypothetical protein